MLMTYLCKKQGRAAWVLDYLGLHRSYAEHEGKHAPHAACGTRTHRRNIPLSLRTYNIKGVRAGSDGEVAGARMSQIEAAHAALRIHGAVLGEAYAHLVEAEQAGYVEDAALLG